MVLINVLSLSALTLLNVDLSAYTDFVCYVYILPVIVPFPKWKNVRKLVKKIRCVRKPDLQYWHKRACALLRELLEILG